MSDSEDEYGPLESSWGSQKKAEKKPGWDSLLDTSVKLGPNGLGAGNLHRRGKNFKPIGEDMILAQRLNKPIATKKKKPEYTQPHSSNNNSKQHHRQFNKPPSSAPKKTAPVLTTRTPVSTSEGSSNWSQASLVDVPFWGNTTTATPPPPIQKQPSPKLKPITPKHNVNRVFTSTPPPKLVESVWEKRISRPAVNESWGAVAKNIEPFTNTGWGASVEAATVDNFEKKKEWKDTDSWGDHDADTRTSDWGSFVKEQPTATTNNNNNHNNNNTIPSSRPSWLTSIPTKDSHSSNNNSSTTTSRFSNPSRQRYSDNAPMDIRPSNYRFDQTPPTLSTAPPPPPENSILVSINVELSDTLKVMVDIRELDEPAQLAKTFGQENNIHAVNILEALTKLFTAQKETALKKKQFKLQRRVYPSQQHHQHNQQRRYAHEPNVYTKSAYQQPYVAPPSSPPPFTRKVYY
ncbi:hypothetical protein INT47_006688 [Mucor saturninus]|uniref:Uncharacterized protein n=1 Tax=Mucor saturninus TaxID=64648 RepID=A0A8H7QTT2_9FUNG|nr:hypothetical protein INT47_006688 [Mucor saturninus]